MRRPIDTHLKPRWGTEHPNPKQKQGIEYTLKLKNKDSKGEGYTTFQLIAEFDPPIALAIITENHLAERKTLNANDSIGAVALHPQKVTLLSIYAIVPEAPIPGTAQLRVRVIRVGDDAANVVLEDGHNAKLVVHPVAG